MRLIIYLFSASCLLGEVSHEETTKNSDDTPEISPPSSNHSVAHGNAFHDDHTDNAELDENHDGEMAYDNEFDLAMRRKLSRYARKRLEMMANFFESPSPMQVTNAREHEGVVCPIPSLPSAFRNFPKKKPQNSQKDD